MDDILPTAKWANRMLRPLTSIYRRLEKHQETLTIIADDAEKRSRSQTPEVAATVTSQPLPLNESLSASGSDADEDDPVWVPGKKPDQRRVRHKYSARGRGNAGKKRTRLSIQSPEASRTLPGAIELATPLITGKRREPPSSAQSQRSAQRPARRSTTLNDQRQLQAFRDKYPLHKSPWQELLHQSGDPGYAAILHNLDRILQSFLNNTRIDKNQTDIRWPKNKLGARSLLSMAMRRLPEFIANEQEAQVEEEEIEEDMCDAYFTELESYYAPHGKGWKPLREAVRTQGIFLISSMITNRWVTEPIACALIDKCKNHDSDACESLLSNFLSMSTSYPPPVSLRTIDSTPPGDPVGFLRKYANHELAQRSYVFDEISKLLISGVLPPEWMATKTWNSWMTRATISFSRGDPDCAAASRLIEADLLSASGSIPNTEGHSQEDLSSQSSARFTRALSVASNDRSGNGRACPAPVEDALSNHVISLLGAICGMHISRSRSDDDCERADGARAGHIVSSLSFNVERTLDSRHISSIATQPSHQLLRCSCIVLADCLVQCNDAILLDDDSFLLESTLGLEECSKIVSSRSDLVKELALFVKQTLRCFGSLGGVPPIGTGNDFREIISKLPHIADEASVGLSRLLSRVAVDAAMDYAETTGEPDDHLWAMEIQEIVNTIQYQTEGDTDFADEPENQPPKRGLFRWEESIGEWVARTPGAKFSQLSPVHRRDRISLALQQASYVPCSTGSSSPDSERYERSVSSLTSSPSTLGTGNKRNFEEKDSSPTRPAKRRRAASVIIVKKDADSEGRSQSAGTTSRSPSLEPVPTERRILRDMSNRRGSQAMPPTAIKPASKIEVVIINQKKPDADEKPIQPAPEVVEKDIHRTVERRRRSGRPPISRFSAHAARVPRRRSVIPYSQDDSEDELSFF